MKTDDLIQRLGNELRPVRPLAPPWRRARMWFACGAGYVLVVAIASWFQRGALLGVSRDPAYLVQQLALVATAVLASDAAFASVVPGVSRAGRWAPLVPAGIVMATLAWGIRSDVAAEGVVGLGRETDWPCVASIAIGAAVLWAVAALMLRRGAPLSPGTTSILAGFAAVSLANVEACVTRAHLFNVTVLLWHGVTSLLVLALVVVTSRHVLPWAPRTQY